MKSDCFIEMSANEMMILNPPKCLASIPQLAKLSV